MDWTKDMELGYYPNSMTKELDKATGYTKKIEKSMPKAMELFQQSLRASQQQQDARGEQSTCNMSEKPQPSTSTAPGTGLKPMKPHTKPRNVLTSGLVLTKEDIEFINSTMMRHEGDEASRSEYLKYIRTEIARKRELSTKLRKLREEKLSANGNTQHHEAKVPKLSTESEAKYYYVVKNKDGKIVAINKPSVHANLDSKGVGNKGIPSGTKKPSEPLRSDQLKPYYVADEEGKIIASYKPEKPSVQTDPDSKEELPKTFSTTYFSAYSGSGKQHQPSEVKDSKNAGNETNSSHLSSVAECREQPPKGRVSELESSLSSEIEVKNEPIEETTESESTVSKSPANEVNNTVMAINETNSSLRDVQNIKKEPVEEPIEVALDCNPASSSNSSQHMAHVKMEPVDEPIEESSCSKPGSSASNISTIFINDMQEARNKPNSSLILSNVKKEPETECLSPQIEVKMEPIMSNAYCDTSNGLKGKQDLNKYVSKPNKSKGKGPLKPDLAGLASKDLPENITLMRTLLVSKQLDSYGTRILHEFDGSCLTCGDDVSDFYQAIKHLRAVVETWPESSKFRMNLVEVRDVPEIHFCCLCQVQWD